MIKKQAEKISKWKELNTFFKKRRKSPLDHPEFLIYFVLVIFGFGAIGIWSSLYIENYENVYNHSNIVHNIASFAIAIISAGSIELMFVENKYIKNPLFLISISTIIASVFIFFATLKIGGPMAYLLAIPFGIFSLYIWWIANAENANLTKNYFNEQSNTVEGLMNNVNDYE